ncbi:hypothetical protein [Nonomuraea sp. NPDC049784]|uniref:hypothetical protein n=1 Tax=Nonomuraea sp. NPDC049784 TaxID=3154361 RepID=UPI0033EAB207
MTELGPEQEGFVLLRDHSLFRIYIRRWRPGDSLSCAETNKRGTISCGPPVAVSLTQDLEPNGVPRTSRFARRRRVVCALHVPTAGAAGQEAAAARKAATERLISEHWDQFQSYVEQETTRRIGALFVEGVQLLDRLFEDGGDANA